MTSLPPTSMADHSSPELFPPAPPPPLQQPPSPESVSSPEELPDRVPTPPPPSSSISYSPSSPSLEVDSSPEAFTVAPPVAPPSKEDLTVFYAEAWKSFLAWLQDADERRDPSGRDLYDYLMAGDDPTPYMTWIGVLVDSLLYFAEQEAEAKVDYDSATEQVRSDWMHQFALNDEDEDNQWQMLRSQWTKLDPDTRKRLEPFEYHKWLIIDTYRLLAAMEAFSHLNRAVSLDHGVGFDKPYDPDYYADPREDDGITISPGEKCLVLWPAVTDESNRPVLKGFALPVQMKPLDMHVHSQSRTTLRRNESEQTYASVEIHGWVIEVVCSSILDVWATVIVNAANKNLSHGGGIAKAIAQAAGPDFDEHERKQVAANPNIMKRTGVISRPGKLAEQDVEYIIQVAGPDLRESWDADKGWTTRQPTAADEADLRRAIRAVFELDKGDNNVIAMPIISGGIFGYPFAEAVRIHVEEVFSIAKKSHHPRGVKLVHNQQKAVRDIATAVKRMAEKEEQKQAA